MSDVRDGLIKETAESLGLPEEWVERIIMTQFKQVNKATYSNNEVEICGFGKFLQSQHKLKRRVEKLNRVVSGLERKLTEATEWPEVVKLGKRLDDARIDLAYYISRIKPEDVENNGNSRGVEKPLDTTRTFEG